LGNLEPFVLALHYVLLSLFGELAEVLLQIVVLVVEFLNNIKKFFVVYLELTDIAYILRDILFLLQGDRRLSLGCLALILTWISHILLVHID